jgi:hypothetical protein
MTLRSLTPFLTAALLLLGACNKDEDANAPSFKLTEEQKRWSLPYQNSVIWRFESSQGQQRRYQTGNFVTQDLSIRNASNDKTHYYREVQAALLQRTDSVYQPNISPLYKFNMQFQLGADIDPGVRRYDERFEGYLIWHGLETLLPLVEVVGNEPLPPGWTLHPTYTVRGVAYQNVLEYVPTRWLGPANAAYHAVQIFYERDNGVLQFKERGGTVWTRL